MAMTAQDGGPSPFRGPGSAGLAPTGALPVVYIAGRGRSGSTVLDNLLGQVEGVLNVGELRLWNRRWHEGARCGCGAALAECPVWGRVIPQAFGQGPELERAMARNERSLAAHRFPAMLASAGRRSLRRAAGAYLTDLERLYATLRAVTGCRVVVDSSKTALYGLYLSYLPGVELHVLHLIRDPRAVAYSWRRQRQARLATSDPLYRRQLGPVRSTLLWDMANAAAGALADVVGPRYHRVRYEDFARSPATVVREVLGWVGLAGAALPFVSATEAHVRPTHTVSGNPKRFREGPVVLKPDEEWQHAMAPSDRRVVSALSSPWLRRYGYDT